MPVSKDKKTIYGEQSRTILVTGGAGFIGSHLIEQLVKDKNNKVISLDNYFTGSKDNHIAGAEYREGHTKDIEKHIPETPDVIYHLGEYSRIARSIDEPEIVFDLNMIGTFWVLEYWRARKCKLVYAGSSTKFTSADKSPYSWSKAANSDLVSNYGKWFGLPYSTAYFYNVYGPKERADWKTGYGTVIETFKQKYLSGLPCEVNAPGTQTRAFTHVDDTIDGLILIGEKGEPDEYAICAKEVYSLLDVAKMFGCEVIMKPQTKTSRSSGADDTSKLEALGWRQKHKLEEYIGEIKRQK
ncbi:MAG: NAD-dependent epimerase/dehydratase family protein [Candidatus Paceibacterota bacterium]